MEVKQEPHVKHEGDETILIALQIVRGGEMVLEIPTDATKGQCFFFLGFVCLLFWFLLLFPFLLLFFGVSEFFSFEPLFYLWFGSSL